MKKLRDTICIKFAKFSCNRSSMNIHIAIIVIRVTICIKPTPTIAFQPVAPTCNKISRINMAKRNVKPISMKCIISIL